MQVKRPKLKKLKIKNLKSINELKFDEKGLIPAIVQDVKNKEVLMVAYMNKVSLKKTISTGLATYWSRSRKCLWLKGDTSGHFQIIKKIHFSDLDMPLQSPDTQQRLALQLAFQFLYSMPHWIRLKPQTALPSHKDEAPFAKCSCAVSQNQREALR